MRIGFVTFEYPPAFSGGAGIYGKKLTDELVRCGHEVVIFTPQSPYLSGFNRRGLEIVEVVIDAKTPFKAAQFWLNLPHFINREYAKKKFDIFHFNGAIFPPMRLVTRSTPVVTTVHHLSLDVLKKNNPSFTSMFINIGNENGLLLPVLEYSFIRSSDYIIAVSDYTKFRILKKCRINSSKMESIYNGVEKKNTSFSEEELNEIRNEYGLIGEKIVLFVGRINDSRKGLKELLSAFKPVYEATGATLVIVGGGENDGVLQDIRQLGIENCTVLTGFVDDITLQKLYQTCDVYVTPSKLEGFGFTIVDAMLASKPIVALNDGAIPEIMGPLNKSHLLSSSNPSQLAMKLIWLLTNMDKGKMMGIENYQKASAMDDWSGVAKKVILVYKKLAHVD